MTYTPNTDEDRRIMLESIGLDSIDQLFTDIPKAHRDPDLKLQGPLSEMDVLAHLQSIANENVSLDQLLCFAGGGWYDHYVPAFVDQLMLRSEFYTAYTPYQPEISQGTLQVIYEFQSMVCDLTQLDVANASMYDGGSALAEAISVATNFTGRSKVLIAETVDPAYVSVAKTYASPVDITISPVRNFDVDQQGVLIERQERLQSEIDDETACVVLQRPNFFGWLEEHFDVIATAQQKDAIVIVVGDPVPLGLIKPPGDLGADIAVGELRHLVGPPAFGGPGAGYFAAKSKFLRSVPGRIAGKTKDNAGRDGYVLTLRTREQDIRRERASSNICTNEALVALGATIHMAALGKTGLQHLARLCVENAHLAAERIPRSRFKLGTDRPFLREFPVICPIPAEQIIDSLAPHGILPGIDLGQFWPELANHLLIAFTEKTSEPAIDRLMKTLGGLK